MGHKAQVGLPRATRCQASRQDSAPLPDGSPANEPLTGDQFGRQERQRRLIGLAISAPGYILFRERERMVSPGRLCIVKGRQLHTAAAAAARTLLLAANQRGTDGRSTGELKTHDRGGSSSALGTGRNEIVVEDSSRLVHVRKDC